jgi:hypothetical protein
MSESQVEEHAWVIRRKKILEKAKRYREKKKLEYISQKGNESKWKYSVSSLVKKEYHSSRIHLYQWFMEQTQKDNSPVQLKILCSQTFNQTYEIVMSKITKKPVVRWKSDMRTLDTYDCQKLNQEIKNLFEDWLKEDEEFYQQITSDESFTSQFKISQRAIKKEVPE